MGLMVDPEKDSGSERVSEGRKLSMAVGMNRWTAGTGTPMMTMGFVVLKDSAKKDAGQVFMERFAITQSAIFRLARWAQACGWMEPFDAENDDHIQRIMARGPVVAILKKGKEYKGEVRVEVDSFERFNGQSSPEWDALTTAGEQEYNRIQVAMENKRNSGGGGGGGPTQYNSGNGNGNGSGSAPSAPPRDDIPFIRSVECEPSLMELHNQCGALPFGPNG